MTNASLNSLAEHFKVKIPQIAQSPIVAGFDGFVDEIISVVEERKSLTEWEAVDTIARFGELVTKAAGKSSLREIVVHRMDAGGCTVNFGDGAATLGIPFHSFATLGTPIHSAFNNFVGKCASCHSWGDTPGRTLAMEFRDGKYMLSAVSPLADFTPDHLTRMLSDGFYQECCNKAKLIALTDWTLYPHMTACWNKLNNEVYSKLPGRLPLYIDLVDPSSRSGSDIQEMLATVSSFQKNLDTILGLNGVEANVIAKSLGLSTVAETRAEIENQAEAIRKKLNISAVAIHCVKIASMADATGTYSVDGPYCAKPLKSTGAGDRFNAGFCVGTILQLPQAERLLLAAATSGFFVRKARSAKAEELLQFIIDWSQSNI